MKIFLVILFVAVFGLKLSAAEIGDIDSRLAMIEGRLGLVEGNICLADFEPEGFIPQGTFEYNLRTNPYGGASFCHRVYKSNKLAGANYEFKIIKRDIVCTNTKYVILRYRLPTYQVHVGIFVENDLLFY